MCHVIIVLNCLGYNANLVSQAPGTTAAFALDLSVWLFAGAVTLFAFK